jgi:hypothetical protein
MNDTTQERRPMNQAAGALPELYESDETAWLEANAELIAHGKHDELDYPHLEELLNDMARRDKTEVENRLALLIAHLLKWTHQKKKRTGSWRATIIVQSTEVARLLKNRTLRNHAETVLTNVYKDAVRAAAAETRLPAREFPKKCPYTLDMLVAEDLLGD